MSDLLKRIDSPQDLHECSDEELEALAQEVREYIIDTVGEIGGHFGANLGALDVEHGSLRLHGVRRWTERGAPRLHARPRKLEVPQIRSKYRCRSQSVTARS